MLTIRDEQLALFGAQRHREVGEKLLSYLSARFPSACAEFDEAEQRAMMALALRKSREHGFTSIEQLLRYVNVMYALGCEFEADPEYPWARAIMAQPGVRPGSKIDQLVDRTAAHLGTLTAAELST